MEIDYYGRRRWECGDRTNVFINKSGLISGCPFSTGSSALLIQSIHNLVNCNCKISLTRTHRNVYAIVAALTVEMGLNPNARFWLVCNQGAGSWFFLRTLHHKIRLGNQIWCSKTYNPRIQVLSIQEFLEFHLLIQILFVIMLRQERISAICLYPPKNWWRHLTILPKILSEICKIWFPENLGKQYRYYLFQLIYVSLQKCWWGHHKIL